MKKLVAALAVGGILLAGCGGPERPCLKSHEQTELTPVFIGKTFMELPRTVTVCDEYGPLPTTTKTKRVQ